MSELKNYENENYIKEIIDGKVYYMSPGTSIHVWVITRLAFEFNHYFNTKNKKCMAMTEGLEVFLNGEGSKHYVVPDVSIICDKSKLSERGYEGAPELIVEVLSPATAKKDKREKLISYEKAKVKEYWIVDTKNKSIDQYVLENHKYELKDFVTLMNEVEFNKLTDKQRETYTSKIKPSIFDDLEIDLNNIFDF